MDVALYGKSARHLKNKSKKRTKLCSNKWPVAQGAETGQGLIIGCYVRCGGRVGCDCVQAFKTRLVIPVLDISLWIFKRIGNASANQIFKVLDLTAGFNE